MALRVGRWVLTAGLLLGAASMASAQSPGVVVARGSVHLTIQPVMQVDVNRSGPLVVRADGEYDTVVAATRVRVSANFAWRLVAVRRPASQLPASSGGMAVAGVQPVWVRADAPDDRVTPVARDYVQTAGGEVVVAEGEAGDDMEVVVDYRWPREARAGGDTTRDVSFVLVPR